MILITCSTRDNLALALIRVNQLTVSMVTMNKAVTNQKDECITYNYLQIASTRQKHRAADISFFCHSISIDSCERPNERLSWREHCFARRDHILVSYSLIPSFLKLSPGELNILIVVNSIILLYVLCFSFRKR